MWFLLIKRPDELEEIMKVYAKHARVSEAKINEEKTQIFSLGVNNPENEHQQFRERKENKVKILGAIFCKVKREETEENFKKPTQTLRNLKTLDIVTV